jgi:hypothetical protein
MRFIKVYEFMMFIKVYIFLGMFTAWLVKAPTPLVKPTAWLVKAPIRHYMM